MFRDWIHRLARRGTGPTKPRAASPPPLPHDAMGDRSHLDPLPATAIEIEWASYLAPPPAPRKRSVTPLTTAALEHLMRTPDQRIDIAEFIRTS